MPAIAQNRAGDPCRLFAADWISLCEFSRQARHAFGARLKSVILYGSRARGEGDPDSDIDVMVVLETLGPGAADWDRCIDIAAEIGSRSGELISVLACGAREFARRESPLLINVRKDGVALP